MGNQLLRKRTVQIAVLVNLLIILLLAYFFIRQQMTLLQTDSEGQIEAAYATAEVQNDLLTTAEARTQASMATAVVEGSLRATADAQVIELVTTIEAQAQITLPTTIESQPLVQDQQALAYQLALESELILNEQPALLERSVLLAIEAVQRYPHAGTVSILKNGVTLLPRYDRALSHRDFGYILAYSPNGKYVASTGNDNDAVLIWDIDNDREAARLVYEDRISKIAFSPEGLYLVIVWGDIFAGENNVTIWEIATGQETISFPLDSAAITLKFSPDTNYLAIATEETVSVLDITTGQEVMSLPNNGTDVTFSTDGQSVYTVNDGVQQWSIATGQHEGAIISEETIEGQTVFSPQSKYLFHNGYSPKIWALETGMAVELETSAPYRFFEIIFSADEKYLVTTQLEGSLAGDTFGQNLVQLWDVATGREMMHIEDFAFDVTFSPDSRYLVVPMGEVARVWELPSQQEVFRIVRDETISSPTFSPDGRTVIVHNSNSITGRKSTDVWEMIPAQWYWRFEHGSPSGIYSMAFSPDGQYLATGGEENIIHVWDTETGEEVAHFDHQQYHVLVVAFSPDGRYLLSGGTTIPYGAEYTSVTHLWDMVTGSEAISLTHDYQVVDASFSPDGRYFATIGQTANTVSVFDAESGTEIFSIQNKGYLGVRFSPNGQYMATMDLDTIWLWDTTKWREVMVITEVYSANFRFGPDDRVIVFEGRDTERNSTLYVREIATNREVLKLPYEDGVRSIDISPDNQYLAVSSGSFWEYNSALQIWNIASGDKLIDLPTNNELGKVTFSHDGRYLAFESTEGVVSVLDMTTQEEVARLMHPRAIFSISFSPDNRQLLVQSGISTVYLRRWLPDDIVAEACNRLSRNLTLEEWQTFIGDEPYHPTCPNLPSE
ncbi:MAG: WD40 repeat domain-containing protein [Chloroflexi bacterium]|nr:WD40 repeat domain-containing protein [Chloroflexota bacterium]MCI0579667.1 WD40 repeat domain-containing protein [Chloroflexota bacterium]MCI0645893.1 WD40 repeat domain-containing protein [Chloroflexota bacterium]MCI0725748.1 WD40 repeat domain-containing protein [Chloroflexota bacterium]